jgi:hypothetical protein
MEVTMKRYYAMLAILALATAAAAGLFLQRSFTLLRTELIEERKQLVALFVREQAEGTVSPEDFSDTGGAHAQEALKTFWAKMQIAELARVKMWNNNYVIAWSNLRELIGRKFPDSEGIRNALEGTVQFGKLETASEEKPENVSEREFRDLYVFYVPLLAENGSVYGVVELYEPMYFLDSAVKSQFRSTLVSTITGAAAFYVAAAALLYFFFRRKAPTGNTDSL